MSWISAKSIDKSRHPYYALSLMAVERHNQIGQLLRIAREAAGLSRSALARHVGLDASYIYRMEVSDRRPSRESILTIAEVLKLNDKDINKWLMAAGHAPMPLLTMVRAAMGTQDAKRRPSAEKNTPDNREAARWANWLEAMGLQESMIGRLLQTIEIVDLAQQQKVTQTISTAISRVTEMLESPVCTAVIPAAGGQHKLVAPHVMQRLLLSAIGEAAESGISKIILVLAPGMMDVLYTPLKTALDLAVIPLVELHYCEQVQPQGLGDAILQAEAVVGEKPFAVLLPDDIIRQRVGRAALPRELRRMMDIFGRLDGTNLVAVTSVPKSKMSNYGIAKVSARAIMSHIRVITQLVEKPDHTHAISRYARAFGIVGRYLMQPDIFRVLREQKEEGVQRVQLTDALERLRKEGSKIYAFEMEAQRQDIGEFLGRASDLIGGGSKAGSGH